MTSCWQQLIVGAILPLSIGAVIAHAQATSQANADTYSYLSGRYEVIGRLPDSTRTYRGTIRLEFDGTQLRMKRTIRDETVVGSARIDVSGSDKVQVLRGTFSIGGEEFKATYLWRSDLDNYPIVTGRMFRDGTKTPGIEAWFPIPGQ